MHLTIFNLWWHPVVTCPWASEEKSTTTKGASFWRAAAWGCCDRFWNIPPWSSMDFPMTSIHTLYIIIYWNDHGSVNTPRVSWWFFGGNNLVNFLVRKLTLIHDACFLVIFPWQQPLAPRHWNDHGSVKTPRAWSGNGAGTKRERSGNEADSMISTFFHGFPWFSCLPLRSRFAPASLPLSFSRVF